MAEVLGILGLIGSIIGILDGVHKTRATFKKYVHKSSSLKKELIPILGKLTAFTGILRGLQLECELDESDSARQQIIEHIRAPLEASEKAAKIIMARLNQVISVGGISLAFGKIVNKETATALNILEQAKYVLDLAIDVDQRTLLKAIEKYVRTVAGDLHSMLEQGELHYKDLKDNLQNIRSNDEEARKGKMKAALLSWVSQVNYSSNFDAAQLRTYENDRSGEWFLCSRIFDNWWDSASRSGLLITGNSGAGKTILFYKAICHVLQNQSLDDKANIIYFFFDFNDIAKQSVEGMVRSLIYQLVAKADGIPNPVQNLYSKYQSETSRASLPRSEEWKEVLVALLQGTEHPCIFIDALDECTESESQDLQKTIESLFKKGGANIRLLLTARPSPSPRTLSFLKQSGFIHLSMEKGAISKDIELHLRARLEYDTRLSSFGLKAREMIISGIVSKSAGMFRYAECQLSTLSKLKDHRVKKIREVLDNMPASLQSTYSEILDELHNSDEWPILERTLALVSYSARPVTIQEVGEFAILEDEMTSMQSEERFDDFGEILVIISSLIDVQDGYLTLAHQSVQEFLNSEPGAINYWLWNWWEDSLLFHGADLYIAKRCFQYLSFPQRPACEFREYDEVKNRNAKHLTRLLSDYPFLDYAASRWTYHVRSEDVRSTFPEEMQNTLPLTVGPNLWKAWLLLQRADIWETRIQLARLLCEVSIRYSTLPGWACNFWKVRQDYRFKTNTQEAGHADEKLCVRNIQDGGPSSLRILHEIRGKATKQRQNHQSLVLTAQARSLHDLAVVLLEVALQTSLYSDLNKIVSNMSTAKDLKGHLRDMLALSKYAAKIMGKQYATVVNECLSIIEPGDEARVVEILKLQDKAMEKFHDPLQSMLKLGFRASRGPVTSRHGIKMKEIASWDPCSLPNSVDHAAVSTAGYNWSGASTFGYEDINTQKSETGTLTMVKRDAATERSEPLPKFPRWHWGNKTKPGTPTVASSNILKPKPDTLSKVGVGSSSIVYQSVTTNPYSGLRNDFPITINLIPQLAKPLAEQDTISSKQSVVTQNQKASASGLEGLLQEWMRHIGAPEDRTFAMREYLTNDQWDKRRNKEGPFELGDENKERVTKPNGHTAVESQSRKDSGERRPEPEDKNWMDWPSFGDDDEKTGEELAFQLMRRILREKNRMSDIMGYIPNDERNRRKNERGPFELASGID